MARSRGQYRRTLDAWLPSVQSSRAASQTRAQPPEARAGLLEGYERQQGDGQPEEVLVNGICAAQRHGQHAQRGAVQRDDGGAGLEVGSRRPGRGQGGQADGGGQQDERAGLGREQEIVAAVAGVGDHAERGRAHGPGEDGGGAQRGQREREPAPGGARRAAQKVQDGEGADGAQQRYATLGRDAEGEQHAGRCCCCGSRDRPLPGHQDGRGGRGHEAQQAVVGAQRGGKRAEGYQHEGESLQAGPHRQRAHHPEEQRESGHLHRPQGRHVGRGCRDVQRGEGADAQQRPLVEQRAIGEGNIAIERLGCTARPRGQLREEVLRLAKGLLKAHQRRPRAPAARHCAGRAPTAASARGGPSSECGPSVRCEVQYAASATRQAQQRRRRSPPARCLRRRGTRSTGRRADGGRKAEWQAGRPHQAVARATGCAPRRPHPGPAWKQAAAASPALIGTPSASPAQLRVSISLLTVRFRSLSWRRCSSILAMECITVVWCLPPNCRPISGRRGLGHLLGQVHGDLARDHDLARVVLLLQLRDAHAEVLRHRALDGLDGDLADLRVDELLEALLRDGQRDSTP